jgi:hypothetical protein
MTSDTDTQVEKFESHEAELLNDILQQLKRPQPVSIINFNMPFWALVGLMIKVSLASIPAMLIMGILGAVVTVCVWMVIGFLSMGLMGSF